MPGMKKKVTGFVTSKQDVNSEVSGASTMKKGREASKVTPEEKGGNEASKTMLGMKKFTISVADNKDGFTVNPVQERKLPETFMMENTMPKNVTTSLKSLSKINGFIGAAVVDSDSGMAFGTVGGNPNFDIDMAAAANTDVMAAKLRAKEVLELDDNIDDILITLSSQYHILRPLSTRPSVFIYLALASTQANLAMARMKVKSIEKDLVI